MRCPKCRKTLEPDAKICPSCKRIIVVASDDSLYSDILKPRSRISTKGFGSKMSGTSHVTGTRHTITTSNDSDSSIKIRCTKCGTVNDKSDQFCRNCGTRTT
jgi:rRNA maturation endonuclease Nob1